MVHLAILMIFILGILKLYISSSGHSGPARSASMPYNQVKKNVCSTNGPERPSAQFILQPGFFRSSPVSLRHMRHLHWQNVRQNIRARILINVLKMS